MNTAYPQLQPARRKSKKSVNIASPPQFVTGKPSLELVPFDRPATVERTRTNASGSSSSTSSNSAYSATLATPRSSKPRSGSKHHPAQLPTTATSFSPTGPASSTRRSGIQNSSMGRRNASRSPARAPPVRESSGPSLSRQLTKSVTDWLTGDDRDRRREAPRSDDRRSRAIERHRDTGRGRRRSVSTATESSLVSYSRSRSRASDRSDPPTELGSRSSYTSYSSSSHHKSRRSHHQRRRDRSYSSSRSRSSSRERSHRERKKAIKSGLLLLSSVAAATAVAQKYWSKDGDREDRELDPRESRPGHHRQRSTNERVREEAERVRDDLGGRREGMKSRETAAARHGVDRRDSPRSGNTSATPPARKRSVPPALNPDLSNRERLGLNDGVGIKTTPTSTAAASVTSSSMRMEPPRSVYHSHYEETQYAAVPEDDEAIWVPVEERISLNSRGETVVETIERRVTTPSEAAAKRKSHSGKKAGERERGDADVFRVVERHKIMDEWDPRWKKY